MSGKIKSRNAANADALTGGVSCDERILRDCHQLYTDPDSGELADMKCWTQTLNGNCSNIHLFDNKVNLASCLLVRG